mgnify:CR=1 FL=1
MCGPGDSEYGAQVAKGRQDVPVWEDLKTVQVSVVPVSRSDGLGSRVDVIRGIPGEDHFVVAVHLLDQRILFSGDDEMSLHAGVTTYAGQLKLALDDCLGTEGAHDILLYSASPAPIKRKQRAYRYQILIKLLRTARLSGAIQTIYTFAADHRNELFAMVEVNPQDML